MFKKILSLATKDSHFIFDGTLYKQVDGVAMGSFGPTLGNAFLFYHEKKRLESPLKYRAFYYWRCIYDIFLFYSFTRTSFSQSYLNSHDVNIYENENKKGI